MKDRVSTKMLPNGATRYGVYDEEGNLLRYEYIKLEDEPSIPGDLFNKANMLPDTIPSLLGLKMANPQVKDALNVLANVGNLHVWKRTQVLSEAVPAVPAGYTLGEVETVAPIIVDNGGGQDASYIVNVYYGNTVSVDNAGNVSIVNENSTYCYFKSNAQAFATTVRGKFFRLEVNSANATNTFWHIADAGSGILFADASATATYAYPNLNVTSVQRVTGYPATPEIPAGTHIDHLTSTDPEAYRESSDGAEACYTLGDKQTLTFVITSDYTTFQAATVNIDEDGTISATWSNVNYKTSSSTGGVTISPILAGVFLRPGDGSTDVYWLPSDTVCTATRNSYAQYVVSYTNAQKVIGHAAVPANTTIEYLGQLGGGAKIEVGSYVGTGTYGASNPNTLTFGFVPKLVVITVDGSQRANLGVFVRDARKLNAYWYGANGYVVTLAWDKKGVSWHSTDSALNQLNSGGTKYPYIAIG